MDPPLSLLLTGASGGGTILNELRNSSHDSIRGLSITALVRSQSQADVLECKGIKTVVLPGGLDDSEGLEKLGSLHDVVLHAATGKHSDSAKALITGLAKRNAGRDSFYIQLSGTTNVCVGDVTETAVQRRTFSDSEEGIYEYELERQKNYEYDQRATDITVIKTGQDLGVRTYIVMPPLIWGRGTGYFKKQSEQIPQMLKNALVCGRLEYVAPGSSEIGHVHVTDLAALYELIVARALIDPGLPDGRNGFFFANTGNHIWSEVMQRAAKIGFERGLLKSAEPVPLEIEDAAAKFPFGDGRKTEYILASSSLTRPDRSYELGWKPKKTEDDWRGCVPEAFDMLLENEASNRTV